ncbi:non-homologous end-joining factor 1 isoform X2 [Paramormyrops kingsleyae]|uniref:Non-homologous end-joining factor 1 n=2 Tax=Paramormyrops kingsleyae TaxID=1676925 RepID=A0A3B3R5U4_9TELE|nr:non-homologous end-joining factor 1 isoform X2 [Paramormyrops kingsleyae]XP_023661434.1 non-homologous end-joining factor 1 isoform X2 [Paramormyrops kingsleyae]XP_023661435.1 non-homologous end-joining factor 1 isoform X2 [Paramormyrops kingsleyae]XP_023661436.1 non-homologous end-joining factor 1 isoform X2 [Paramormyrops kingsleyae]
MSTLALDIDLLLQPWMPVRLGGIQLLAKSYFGDTKYQMLLSDMQSVWEEEVDADTIKERAQELNKRLRAPADAFFAHLRTVARPYLAGEPGAAVACSGDVPSISVVDLKPHRLTLRLKSELAGVPFYWEFRCSSSSVAVVCSQLVCPLLAVNSILQRQVAELAALLVRKDAEIQDYRESGAVLSRGRLQTEVFDELHYRENFITQVLPKVCVQQENFGFNVTLQELYAAVMALRPGYQQTVPPSTVTESGTPNRRVRDGQRPEEPASKKHRVVDDQQDGAQDDGASGTVVPKEDCSTAVTLGESQSTQTVPSNPVPANCGPPRPKKKKAAGLFR